MMTFQVERLCYDVMRQDICCDGTGHEDVPSTGCDDVLVLWVVARIPRHGLRRRAELCLEPGLPLALDRWIRERVGHSINGEIKAMITVIARVMDVWLYHHSVSRAVFSGCLSDLDFLPWGFVSGKHRP